MTSTRPEQRPSRRLTAFQVRCQHEVEALLRSYGIEFTCAKIDGEEESYLVLDANRPSAEDLQIYIYEDEAGFFLSNDWHIWEVPDYSEAALQAAFLEGIRRAIAGDQS